MKRIFIISLGLIGSLFSQPDGAAGDETLIYTAGFRLFSAGKSTMEASLSRSEDGRDTLRISSYTETHPFFDSFYRVRDLVDLWVDPATYEVQKIVRDIHEGRYELQETVRVDREAGFMYTRKDTLPLAGPVYDPISAIYYLRQLDLKVGDKIQLTIFDGRRLRTIKIAVRKKETLEVPAGKFDCLVLKPVPLDDAKLTSVDGLLRLWLADDDFRTPIRVEQRSNIGTMVLRLIKSDRREDSREQ
jgi:hypothetical protein